MLSSLTDATVSLISFVSGWAIAKAEEGTEKNLEDAVEMAKKWVEENKL